MLLLALLILAILLFGGFGFAIHLLWIGLVIAVIVLIVMALTGHLL